jgi:ligand-binding SRPBCC domain-containing protein
MPTVEDSITIERSPEVVWAFLTQTDNIPAFESQVTHIEQVTPGEVGLGTQWQGTTKVLGRSFDWVSEIVEFEPPVRSRTKGGGKLAFEISYSLSPSPDNVDTLFVYRIEAESGLGGIFGRLGDPLVERAQARTVKTNLANLKELIEADT